MSAEFVMGFNEDGTSLLKKVGWWEKMFPEYDQFECPAPTYQVDVTSLMEDKAASGPQYTFLLRWPLLAPIAILGAVIGLMGWWYLRRGTLSQRSWSISFFWFGLMNISALPCHNLHRPDPTDKGYVFWRALDVGFTAAGSLAAIMAGLADMRVTQRGRHIVEKAAGSGERKKKGTDVKQDKISAQHPHSQKQGGGTAHQDSGAGHQGGVFCTGVFIPAVVVAALYGNFTRVPWTNELLYFGLLLACVVVLAVYSFHAPPERSVTGLRVAYVGALLILASLPLDPWLCKWFGPQICFVHLLFLACEVAYVGLLIHLA